MQRPAIEIRGESLDADGGGLHTAKPLVTSASAQFKRPTGNEAVGYRAWLTPEMNEDRLHRYCLFDVPLAGYSELIARLSSKRADAFSVSVAVFDQATGGVIGEGATRIENRLGAEIFIRLREVYALSAIVFAVDKIGAHNRAGTELHVDQLVFQ